MEPEVEIDYDELMAKYQEWATQQSQNVYMDKLVQRMIGEQQKNMNTVTTNSTTKPIPLNVQEYQKEIDKVMSELREETVTAESVFNEEERSRIGDLKALAHNYFYIFSGNSSNVVKENVVIAGGAFVSWFLLRTYMTENAEDIDCFVLGNKDAQDIVRDYLKTLKFKAKDLEYLKGTNAGARKVQEVWEGKVPVKGMRDLVTYQFIFTEAKTREELLADFDYKHCMVSYHNDKLYITRTIYDAIKKKQLIVNNPDVVTQWREEKYKNKGFYPSGEEQIMTLGDIFDKALKNMHKIPDTWNSA